MLMHIYPSWVVRMHKVATLASIPWTHGSKVKEQKFCAHTHLSFMGSPHAQTGNTCIITLDSVHKIPKVKVMTPRSKVTCPKIHTRAHLLLMGSPHTQTDHIGINTLDARMSTRFSRSRSWPQSQRSQDKNSMPMFNYPS